MPQLTRYQDFLERADELGFMPLSPLLPGLPSLSEETPKRLWHTGDAETDPWRWKDRAAQEKRLAYGCILGGHKGFVSARLYPLFYAACHPAEPMPERWAGGSVPLATWRLWQLFEEQPALNTSAVRRLLVAARKAGAGQADAAARELQRDYYITVAGNERKVSQDGRSYGWPVCLYCRVIDWAPADWVRGAADWSRVEARDAILDAGAGMTRSRTDRGKLAAKLGFKRV
jgi:hypothetical protein